MKTSSAYINDIQETNSVLSQDEIICMITADNKKVLPGGYESSITFNEQDIHDVLALCEQTKENTLLPWRECDWYNLFIVQLLPDWDFERLHQLWPLMNFLLIEELIVEQVVRALVQRGLDKSEAYHGNGLVWLPDVKVTPCMENLREAYTKELNTRFPIPSPWDINYSNSKAARVIFGLFDEKDYTDIHIFPVAALLGLLERIKQLNQDAPPYPWSTVACRGAAYGGHLDCLKYLCQKGYFCDYYVFAAAADRGNLHILKYLCENASIRWDKQTCSSAAGKGHLECLKYLRSQGCPWDETTCIAAASGGHLECLKFARESDPTSPCPWSKRVFDAAVAHPACLQYLIDNGCPRT